MSYQFIEVEKMTPSIGAVIHGVDLNRVKNPAVFEEIKRALWEHGVIFFRKQPINPESYVKLGQVFGEPELHEFFPHVDGYPQITKISHQGNSNPDTDRWHHDVTFRRRPSLISILRGVDIPKEGGDTMWMNCGKAFDDMPDAMKTMLLSMEAVHDLPSYFRKMGVMEKMAAKEGISREEYEARIIANNPEVIHPAVVNHPITGRLTLFLNSVWARSLAGVHQDLSDSLLAMVYEWVKKPEFMVRFKWEQDSIAIWDNLATQHYAVFDYGPNYREMQRMTTGDFLPTLDRSKVPEHLAPAGWQSDCRQQQGFNQIIDQQRLANSSAVEQDAVKAIFKALDQGQLDKIANRAMQM